MRRFADRDAHQIFLEPEGLDDPLVYPNGISTSLPADVQSAFLRSIAGLERVEMARPGYAVEYEYRRPARVSDRRWRSRDVPGLFLAGQINGTTGYEEAAAQGLAAGLNAAAVRSDLDAVRFDRRTSYIGVMIDDLTLQGVSEPYRMLTARAEYRLSLRADNATSRLGSSRTRCRVRVGRAPATRSKQHLVAARRAALGQTTEGRGGRALRPLCRSVSSASGRACSGDSRSVGSLRTRLSRQSRASPTRWPSGSSAARPETLDQASRVPGVTPAALSALYVAAVARAAA